MASSPSFRVFVFFLIGAAAPLFLTQCQTTGKSYKDVKYDPAKLKTPAGHGMEKKDYPFDESGAYRKDWVKSNTSGRDRSASPRQEATTTVASAEAESDGNGGRNSYPTYAEAAKARAEGNSGASTSGSLAATPGSQSSETISSSPAPVPEKPAPAQPSYHKVKSGDTLFSLAGRYNTSVPDLKRVNGLKSDSIRVGQSLRIP